MRCRFRTSRWHFGPFSDQAQRALAWHRLDAEAPVNACRYDRPLAVLSFELKRWRRSARGKGEAVDRYTIDPGGAWRRYHPQSVAKGWRMLGTVELSDHSTGALGCSPAGLYVQINLDNVRLLDQAAVAAALRWVVLPAANRRGKKSIRP